MVDAPPWIPRSSIPLALLLPCPLSAQETSPSPKIERPKYRMLAQDEDWSVLRGIDRTSSGDPFDPIKFVPLNSDGSFWASFGGHARIRLES